MLRGRANYLVGSDHSKWRRNVPTYATVILKQVYRGIDVVLYGRDGDIEYDLQVAGCGLEILAITTAPHRIVLRRCEWNDGAFSRLFVSTDNGTAFRQMGADFDVYLGANPAAVYIVRTTYVNNVAMRQLLRSTDDGAAFSPVPGIDPAFQSVRIDPFADRLIVLFSTSALASADGGQT